MSRNPHSYGAIVLLRQLGEREAAASSDRLLSIALHQGRRKNAILPSP